MGNPGERITSYEDYPRYVPLLSNLLTLAIYAIGAYVLANFGLGVMVLYLVYCLWIESKVLSGSCTNCYYYGRICAFGKGRLCSLLLKRGDPEMFSEKEVSWWDILPDFMVSVFPIVGGVVLLIRDFAWLLAALLFALIVLSSAGTAFVRGSLACKFCKQGEIGCPAERLFNKQRRQEK
jgi:hypothetical protein